MQYSLSVRLQRKVDLFSTKSLAINAGGFFIVPFRDFSQHEDQMKRDGVSSSWQLDTFLVGARVVYKTRLTLFYKFANIIIYMKGELPMHPEEVTNKLFAVLPKRTKDVLDQRFGLGKNPKRMTLDAIGKRYGITRERVRQIEADGLARIRKSPTMSDMRPTFAALEKYFDDQGGVLHEGQALQGLASHPKHENHVYFLLCLHDPFVRLHENEHLHDRWAYGKNSEEKADKVLRNAVDSLRKIGAPVEEKKLYEVMSSSAQNVLGSNVASSVLENWLGLSKLIAKNYFGEWGLTEFSAIKPRGMKDLSFMVLSKKGEPMHFSEVAASIGKLIGRSVHVQTVHNELIKDQRFVLVGRGLYALKEWGYEPGVVRDVIINMLKNNGPMDKEKIISFVSEKRFVKPNTILINLENKKHFKKLTDGRYSVR